MPAGLVAEDDALPADVERERSQGSTMRRGDLARMIAPSKQAPDLLVVRGLHGQPGQHRPHIYETVAL